jgi:sarcosine oxidase subunit alpha
VTDGLAVTHTNAKPGLDFDVMRATDIVGGPFTPPGFYYKTFIRPRRLWPVYEKVLRSAAGLGILPKRQADREWRTEYRRRHCDVLVIGGGIAGLSAALRAAELGADVVLCDEDVEPGGALLWESHPPEHSRARALADRARAAGVEILSRAPALGFFDGLVPVWQGSTLHQIRAARHIAATGTLEQPLVFPDNDLPGVMLSGGARRLAALYAVKPGETAVVATTGDRGLDAALALHAAGVRIAAVADLRDGEGGTDLGAKLEAAGIELIRGATVVRALGRQAVTGAIVAPVDAQGYAIEGRERKLPCDLIAVSGGTAPATSLLLQGGAKARYDEATARFVADGLHDIVHAAGSVAGHDDADTAELSGLIAGAEAALALGFGDGAANATLEQDRSRLRDRPAPSPVATPPALARDRKSAGKAFVDLDEDITVKDVAYAAAEGYDSIELSKRYTTVTMGPSQGRFSQLASIRALGAHTGLTLGEVGMTTARPPWVSVPMGALAGRPFEPAKRSAIHGRQREQNATVKWAGDWRRAYDYGDPEAEALAVHESAGVIDVSTLGKLLVRGKDAGEILDRLYPNRFSNLKPGRIRYGVMTSDAGRIMDDGTICRLDDDSFYVTTTSSGAGAIEEWFGWWLATWNLEARVTDVTQALCAINLAGPKAREILAGLTDLDVSPEAFTYLDGKRGKVAGVDALLLRIGFVGEVGYEIHFPAAYGEHVWDALVDAGARPFGLEPQRILRLQKQHIIVGQDTDSESTPYGAAMPWIVKLDKEQDFIGRWALEHAAEHPAEYALVGFTMANGHVPTEGAVVLPGGQVTSSRRSRQLDKVIGMAWVPSAQAVDGATITISDEASQYTATVTTSPFFDPKGEVLRS